MTYRVLFFTLLTTLFLSSPQAYGQTGHKQSKNGVFDKIESLEKNWPNNRGRPMENRVLRFGVHVSGMGKLDPHFAAGSQDRALADMVFNGLLRYQPGNAPRIEPDLAESIPEFTMEKGRQIWTVRLRKGVMFQPGPKTRSYELTAEDVIYSLKKSADPDRSAYAGEYAGLAATEIDRYTVAISLDQPLSSILFLPKLTNYGGGFIISKKAVNAMGYGQYKSHPVGTGPFAFKEYQPGKKLTLEAHKGYFRGKPALDGVEIHFVPDNQSRSAALESGALDVITGIAENGWIESMEGNPACRLDIFGVGEVTTIYFNTVIPPFNDIRVRRAVAYALDRDAFMNAGAKRLSGKIYSPVPDRFLPGGLTKNDAERLGLAYDRNIEKAEQLLSEAGYADGFSLEVTASEKRTYRAAYEVLSRLLARIGITCKVNIETHATMHKLIRRDSNPIVIYIAWRPNADVFLTRFFHSDSIIVTGAKPDTNFSHYNGIDNLIDTARLETNPENQTSLWAQAQIKILDDMAAYPVLYTNQCYVRRANVDYGHPLISTMALYPQFTEKTNLITLPGNDAPAGKL